MAVVVGVFIGQPRPLRDARGEWRSSIYREPVSGPVDITPRGLPGDRSAQPYHGGPDAALCIHLTDHYDFWNAHYGMQLGPGSVGENITLSDLSEADVCAGDTARLGSALVQVSGPRVPCANQARRIGRSDWVKLTVRENRCGFYLRVLEPGRVQAADHYLLQDRINPHGTLPALNRCFYLEFDPDFAEQLVRMPALAPWWREQMSERLADGRDHWSAQMSL